MRDLTSEKGRPKEGRSLRMEQVLEGARGGGQVERGIWGRRSPRSEEKDLGIQEGVWDQRGLGSEEEPGSRRGLRPVEESGA